MNEAWNAMLDAIKAENANAISVRGGRKYTTVAVRNEVARRHLADSIGITTEVIKWAAEKGAHVVVKATIARTSDGMVLATGHAEEIRGQGNVNQTSALENAETSAIGRALAALGCSGGEFASANELDGVERKQTAQKSTPRDVTSVTEPPHDPETGEVREEEAGDPPSVQSFIQQVREIVGPNATREQWEQGYAAAVIDKIAGFKNAARAKRWVEIFADLHGEAISRIRDDGLRSQVRSAIALKTAMINGEKPDPADYGNPFGSTDDDADFPGDRVNSDPIVMGEVPVA